MTESLDEDMFPQNLTYPCRSGLAIATAIVSLWASSPT